MAPTRGHAYPRGRQRRGKQPRGDSARGDINMLRHNPLPLDRITRTRDWWTLLDDIPVHGDALQSKNEGHIRFYFENVDGFSVNIKKPVYNNNNKLQYYNSLLSRLEVDVFGGVEARTNWSIVPGSHQLPRLLQQREGARTITAHNKHERFTIAQQGGTFLSANEFSQGMIESSGSDTTGLGRWCWMKFRGTTVSTRVVMAYSACVTRKQAHNATIAQQRRYWRLQKNNTCPRKLFRMQLIDELKSWREEGDKIILFIDSNENMTAGPLQRMLQDEGLEMKDAIQQRTNMPGPPTFVRGSRQIDAVWTTPDVEVASACFTPFYFGIGDHRGIVIDIPKVSFIGGDTRMISRPTARRLKCNEEEVWSAYNTKLEIYCRQHRVKEKLDHVKRHYTSRHTKLRTVLTSLDKVISDGMRHAEKKCRKIRAGAVPFSPQLAEAGLKIKLWGLVIRHHLGSNINTRYIRRVAQRCRISRALSSSLAIARMKKLEAEAQYKKLKRSAYRLRMEFLQQLLDTKRSPQAKRAIRMIMKHEETRRAWRLINKGRGKEQLNGVSAVQVKVNETWTTLTSRHDVEEAIMKNNSKRFHLASTTPLMQPLAVQVIGYLGNTPLADSIVQGTFNPSPDLDTYTQKFLNIIGKRPTLPSISSNISNHDFQRYWRRCREKTSSSMSGRHFGHYKAASRNTYLSTIHSTFCHITASSGSSIDRWEQGLTVMLEKIKGNIIVDKLRAILLMEADFNFINKLMFGHRLIRNCTDHKRLPQELYGGLANRSAQEVAINRRLVLDTFRLKRRCGVVAGVDAAQCYDRIVHSLAILLSRNEGAPINPLLCMFGAIQGMTYFLRTTFGESTSSYGGRQQVPFQGTCQGNGASPAMWLMISMYLVLLAREEGHATKFTSAFSGITLMLIGFIFVDDTDLIVMGQPHDDAQVVITKMQQAIKFWNGILRVSGGALKPEKCYWYLAHFCWNNGQSTLIPTTPSQIFLTTDAGNQVPIKFMRPDEPTEAVGVWQDLLGTSSKQRQEIIDKIRTTHESLRATPLPRHLNWIGLRQAIWKSIDYVLPATTFTEQDCNKIATELYRPLLPKLGCNRNFPLSLRYNDPSLMGLGLANPYWEQGSAHIEQLLTHVGCDTITGKLLITALEQHQLAIGQITPLFTLPYDDFHHLTDPSWITSTWQFVSKFHIQLRNDDMPSLSLSREGDQPIMSAVMETSSLSIADQISFNRVRCFLQVITMADIATGCGTKIRNAYMEGNKPTSSSYDWQMEKPCPRDFRLWKKCMLRLVTGNNTLNFPVGKWIAKTHMQWKWFYCDTTDRVYEERGNGFVVYRRSMNATRSNQLFITSGGIVPRPKTLHYTTVTVLSPTLVRFEGYCTNLHHGPLSPSFRQATHSFWILENSNITQHAHSAWIYQGLLQGNLRAVCDGSFQPHLISNGMSTSWVIESTDQQHRIEGYCCIADDAADAYRAELLGIYAIINAVYFIEESCAQQFQGILNIGCDNEKAGHKSMIDDPKVSITHKHMDLLKAIRRLRTVIRTTITSYHIYGHQDSHTSYNNLSREAQLNVQMDSNAKQRLVEAFECNTFVHQPSFPQEGYQLWLGGRKIQSHFRSKIRRHIGHHHLRKYLYDKGHISWHTYPLLDWDTLHKFMLAQSQEFCLWYAKHWTNFCGIGKMMRRTGLWQSDLCPCCRRIPEKSTTHLFLCPHPLMAVRRDSSFKDILMWMETVDTDPCILELISTLWYGQQPNFTSEDPRYLVDMWNTMQDIGPHSMWMGLLPQCMIKAQDDYYKSMGLRKTGQKWGTEVIGRCLKATLQLWLQRNEILHLQTVEGVNGMHLATLYSAVEEELDKGLRGLQPQDFYLMNTNIHRLRRDPIESVRGWLCSIKIARGDFDGARTEGMKDRGMQSHQQPPLTAREMNNYLDWRKIQLNE